MVITAQELLSSVAVELRKLATEWNERAEHIPRGKRERLALEQCAMSVGRIEQRILGTDTSDEAMP